MTGSADWSAPTLFKVGFFVELGLVLLAALLGVIFLGAPFPFAVHISVHDFLVALGATAPTALLALLFTSTLGRRILALQRIYEKVKEVLDRPLREFSLLEVVLLAGAAGVGEEVLFRGVLQQLLGLVVTSVIFGALHGLTPAYFVLATGMGLYLGWILDASGNLLIPMVVHWLYDALALYLLRREFLRDAEARVPEKPVESDEHEIDAIVPGEEDDGSSQAAGGSLGPSVEPRQEGHSPSAGRRSASAAETGETRGAEGTDTAHETRVDKESHL